MSKLKLDLDALVVESFDAAPAGADAGTVRGHDAAGGGSRTICQEETCETNCFNTCYLDCTFAETGCDVDQQPAAW